MSSGPFYSTGDSWRLCNLVSSMKLNMAACKGGWLSCNNKRKPISAKEVLVNRLGGRALNAGTLKTRKILTNGCS